MKKIGLLIFLVAVFGCASRESKPVQGFIVQQVDNPYRSCATDPDKQVARSNELQAIVNADQADRRLPGSQIDWNRVSAADETRARRVAEIFAEGCFKSARDYAAAALVFQHGSVPDHYYQAYLWSKKALDLGDETQKLMVANAIDRYLLSLGYKQIFGAQSFRDGPAGCHCLEPVESKFPDATRIKVCGISLAERIATLRAGNQKSPACARILYCEKDLRSPPKGMFPEIW